MENFIAAVGVAVVMAAGCGYGDEDEGEDRVGTRQEEAAVAQLTVAAVKGGNALTLPAQRHLARVGGANLLALQQDGAGGHGLGFYRSDDDGRSWRYLAAIQNDTSHRDTADVLVVGRDVALVYSYEGPTLAGSAAHDVYFQWWRYRIVSADWVPEPPVRVFDSVSATTGYYRAEIARDSLARIWVQAFKLEPNGTSTARIAVSSDDGATFVKEPLLAQLGYRGGGRLISLGGRLLFIYDGHEDGLAPARFRVRSDTQALDQWAAPSVAFAEGIFHGAALSAVADGDGGLHLVYKDKRFFLWYRHFDGTTFGPRTLVEDHGNWELQPAVTRLGDDLAIFYNRVITSGKLDEVRFRMLRAGVLGAAQILDGTTSFKGYPAAVDTLPAAAVTVPCVFGVTPDDQSAGTARLYSVSTPAPGGTLLRDDFDRSIAPDHGLGSGWSIGAGLWYDDGHAVCDRNGGCRATEVATSCADCSVEATLWSYGVPEAAIFVRAPSASAPDRYDVVLGGDRTIQIRRIRGTTTTVLGRTSSGVASVTDPARLALSASGSHPVTLVAWVNGAKRLTVSDTSSSALVSGFAGLFTTSAGVGFDDFVVRAP